MAHKKYIKRAILFNPIVLILYTVLCRYLYELAQYGGVRRRVPIIIGTSLILLGWFVWSFFKYKRKEEATTFPNDSKILKLSKWWFYIAAIFFVSISSITGYKIYESATNYSGKLYWVIDDLRTKRTIPFTKNNIYEDAIHGLLEELDAELTLPNDLYMANEFDLTFDENGEITNIYSLLYGDNEQGEVESFLVNYDATANNKVTVDLERSVNATYDENKKLQPLIDGLNTIPLEEYTSAMMDDSFNLYYEGYAHFPANHDTYIFYNETEIINSPISQRDDIEGYSFTLNAVNNLRDQTTHFTYYDPSMIEARESNDTEVDNTHNRQVAEEYFLTEDVGYQLIILDAALGSRFYGLDKTEDGGVTWETINADPFLGESGVASGVTFINEKLGFVGLSHNGGMHADLFKTADGGASFEKVSLPAVTVYQNGVELEPFDFPEMPYEENDELVLLVNQGSDGDYNQWVRGLFLSTDEGQTWEYFGEE